MHDADFTFVLVLASSFGRRRESELELEANTHDLRASKNPGDGMGSPKESGISSALAQVSCLEANAQED